MALIWSSPTSFGQPECCLSLSEKSPERNYQTNFDTVCFLTLPQHTHHVTFQQPVLRFFLHGNKKAKYHENARFYTPS